jgi:hypothetical protein
MFGVEFYPTPPEIAEKMIAGIKDVAYRNILEPSAGKGDILDVVAKYKRSGLGWGIRKLNAYCIEIDINLQAILREKKYKILASDFLSWSPTRYFDLILMNPPFSNGDEHLLHAWECLTQGDIVCLLNEETIKNPCTKRRRILADIIQQHGSVESLGACFSTAEHKTDVRVAMVRLHKDQPDEYASLFAGLEFESTKTTNNQEPQDIFLPANRNVVGNLCLQHAEALRLFREAKLAYRRLEVAIAPLRKGFVDRRNTDYITSAITDGEFVPAVNMFTEELTRDAWATLTQMAGISQLMTGGVQKEFDRMICSQSSMDFSEPNIFLLLDTLRNSIDGIMRAALLEVFDLLTKYHDENRVHIEGWKTNCAYAVGKKFILPDVVKFDYDRFRMRWSRGKNIADIDRVLCNLVGKKIDDIKTIQQGLEESFERGDGTAESEFFVLRYYKKGTVHFTFKDKFLWERFNVEAARGHEWLPHDFQYKEGCLKIAA